MKYIHVWTIAVFLMTLTPFSTKAEVPERVIQPCEGCSTQAIKNLIKEHYPEPDECPEEDEEQDECQDFDNGSTHYVIDRLTRQTRIFEVEYNEWDILIIEEDIHTSEDQAWINLALNYYDNFKSNIHRFESGWNSELVGALSQVSQYKSTSLTCDAPIGASNMSVYTPLYNPQLMQNIHNTINNYLVGRNLIGSSLSSVGLGVNANNRVSANIAFSEMSKGVLVTVKTNGGGQLKFDLEAFEDVIENRTEYRASVNLSQSFDAEGDKLSFRITGNEHTGFSLHPSYSTQEINNPCLAQEYQRLRNVINQRDINEDVDDIDVDEEDFKYDCVKGTVQTPKYVFRWTGTYPNYIRQRILIGFDDENDDDELNDC